MPGAGRAQLKAYLRDHGVTFEVVEHARSESAAAEARAAHLPAEQTAKAVVLHTPARLPSPSSARRTASTSITQPTRALSRNELSFASEADLARDFPAYEVGAVPPIGPDTPAELIDLRLLEYKHVLCPAGDHEHSLLVDPLDIVRLTVAQTVDLRQD